ncbi:hypothetical protein K493DRAFT_321683 [Basidiobolus meristosporus CBS 931.73]|uniref:Protein Lines N-terminal domain-containing protein n=1 Tax=Basidiobolus meristosporus CBS 931.73 TaxID=1314790 RepID=A0A1Y1WQL3_9FUNG|nr:hypothetical protein K493DRAFT_321683 [Basidiobolus meristosporus CBS 931.73]|eukprot:ORX75566.1 hypothetical protein K493DRAFT_321683 [Basidiobolus meristosporus CBS 931.73]
MLFRIFGDDSDMIWVLFTFQKYETTRAQLPAKWKAYLNKIAPLVTIHDVVTRFFDSLAYDYEILLDFLISSETCELFLTFLVRYLRGFFDASFFANFMVAVPQEDIVRIYEMFGSLEASIRSSLKRNIFPYNATPLVNRLAAVHELLDTKLNKQ